MNQINYLGIKNLAFTMSELMSTLIIIVVVVVAETRSHHTSKA